MEQLSGQDATFVYLETAATPMHVSSLAIYDPSTAPGGFVRYKDILRFIESRLGCARSFRQKLVRVPLDLDHPYWIEDGDFDLEYHVRHIALPKPGDWRQLCIQVARLHARPLDLSKPLWEFWIIEGLDKIDGLPPGSFASFNKVHHAAIDGMSGVEMISALHDLTADMPKRPDNADWRPENKPSFGELAARTYINALKKPFQLAGTVWKTVPAVARLTSQVTAGDVSLGNAKLAPKTRFNRKVKSHRVFDAATFPMADIRKMKDAVAGTTVNDVILTIIGGALRKYLLGHGELPAESLTAMAPISVRGNDEKSSMGNRVSAMLVNLGTLIDDPLERLSFIHSDTANSKAMTDAVGARTLTDYSQLIPAGLSGLAARLYTQLGTANSHAPVFNTVASNVPGSRVPLYFAGARMVRIMGLGPIFDGFGLFNAIFSYVDDITISFTCDRDMMPDPETYTNCLRTSFYELKVATEGGDFSATTQKQRAAAPHTKPAATKKRKAS